MIVEFVVIRAKNGADVMLDVRDDMPHVLHAQDGRSISLDLSALNGHCCGCSFGPPPDH